WEEHLHPLPVPLPPVHGEVLGCYLHRLAEANGTTPGRLAQCISPHARVYFTLRTDPLRRWTPAALPRLSIMTGIPVETLNRSLPAFTHLAARENGTSPRRGHAHYDLHVTCRHCMKSRGISGPVLAHRGPAARLCLKHAIWLDGYCHYYVGHIDGGVSAQRRHIRLARRFPDTITAATKEAVTLTRAWLLAGYQPAPARRCHQRAEALPKREAGHPSLLRYRYHAREGMQPAPAFVRSLAILADHRGRPLRIHRAPGVAFARHPETIDAIYAEAERRLSIHTLREMPDARHAFRN